MEYAGIRAVLITGHPSEAVVQRTAAEGLAGVLIKPLEITDLLGVLESGAPPQRAAPSGAQSGTSVTAGV